MMKKLRSAWVREVRGLLPFLAAWWLLLGIDAAVVFGRSPKAVWSGEGILQVVTYFLPGLIAFLSAQQDPASGPRAFWRTRPLSWPYVLGVKVLVLAFLVVLPWAATHLALLLQEGAPLALLPEMIPEALSQASISVVCGLFLGSVSRSLAVGFLGFAGAWFVWGVFFRTVQDLANAFGWAFLTLRHQIASTWEYRGLMILFILAPLLLVVYQYWTRRTARTLALAALFLIAGTLTFRAAGWVGLAMRPPVEGHPTDSQMSVELFSKGRSISGLRGVQESGKTELLGQITLALERDGLGIQTVARHSTLRIPSHGEWSEWAPFTLVSTSHSREGLHGVIEKRKVAGGERAPKALMALDSQVFDRVADLPAELLVTFYGRLHRTEWYATLPLVPGAQSSYNNGSFEVRQVSFGAEAQDSRDSEEGLRSYRLAIDLRGKELKIRSRASRAWQGDRLASLTAKGGLSNWGCRGFGGPRHTKTSQRKIPLPWPHFALSDGGLVDHFSHCSGPPPEGWLEDLRLLLYREIPMNHFSCRLEVGGFRPRDLTRQAWRAYPGGSGLPDLEIKKAYCTIFEE